jgi:hypothetical protein
MHILSNTLLNDDPSVPHCVVQPINNGVTQTVGPIHRVSCPKYRMNSISLKYTQNMCVEEGVNYT